MSESRVASHEDDGHVSSSQIAKISECKKKYFYRYILGIKEPESPDAAFGKGCHAELEHYLKTGEIRPSQYSLHIKAVAPHFPEPSQELLVEYEFKIPTYPDGPPQLGYIDCADLRPEIPSIYDLKTKKKNLERAKTPEELESDIQMIIYAKAAWHLTGKVTPVEVGHGYVTQKPIISKRESTIVTPEQVENVWNSEIIPRVREIVELREQAAKGLTVEDVEGNREACERFGPRYGCPYRAQCSTFNKPTAATSLWKKLATIQETKIEVTEEDFFERNQKVATTSPADPTTASPKAIEPEVKIEVKLEVPPKVEPEVKEPEKPEKPIGPPKDLTLYIDCVPLIYDHAPIVMFETWINEINRSVCEDHKVHDYKTIEFGKGPGFLAAKIREKIDTVPKHVVINSFIPGAHEAISVLVPLAKLVVRKCG